MIWAKPILTLLVIGWLSLFIIVNAQDRIGKLEMGQAVAMAQFNTLDKSISSLDDRVTRLHNTQAKDSNRIVALEIAMANIEWWLHLLTGGIAIQLISVIFRVYMMVKKGPTS